MANRRMLDGSVDQPLDSQSIADPATMFNASGGYDGAIQSPQRRSMSSGQPGGQSGEDIIPQYIPPATMGQLFQELRRR